MGKYTAIFRTSFKQESKTFANSIIIVFSFFVIIYIFRQLWQFIYGGSGVGALINGYTFEMMLWYMIMAEVLMYAMNCRAVTRAFSNDIKSGKIAYQLNKPYNYYGYQVATQIGAFVWKLLFLIPSAIIIGTILLGPIPNFHMAYILPLLISVILATTLTVIMYGSIGLLAFWIEESTPFTWILQKFVMLFGLFFPPEFFPKWLQPIIIYSPIYAMMSGPSKLLANFSWIEFYKLSALQVGYLLLTITIGQILFNKGKRKVNVHGG